MFNLSSSSEGMIYALIDLLVTHSSANAECAGRDEMFFFNDQFGYGAGASTVGQWIETAVEYNNQTALMWMAAIMTNPLIEPLLETELKEVMARACMGDAITAAHLKTVYGGYLPPEIASLSSVRVSGRRADYPKLEF